MKTTHLAINSEILTNIISMSAEDIHELVETVGLSASLNDKLNNSIKDKIVIALAMLKHSKNMLEQCGCSVQLQIHHSMWTEPVSYTTDIDSQEEL